MVNRLWLFALLIALVTGCNLSDGRTFLRKYNQLKLACQNLTCCTFLGLNLITNVDSENSTYGTFEIAASSAEFSYERTGAWLRVRFGFRSARYVRLRANRV